MTTSVATPVVAVGRDAVEHFIVESLRQGMSRQAVREFLDVRLVTAIGYATSGDQSLTAVEEVLDKYVTCRVLLDQTHLLVLRV